MKVNEEKREKFIECAGKRVNNVLHDMQILEPMARSSVYDFTKQDIEEMFFAMQETLDNVKAEFYKKFEEKAKSEKKVFSFGRTAPIVSTSSSEDIMAEEVIAPVTTADVEVSTDIVEEAIGESAEVVEPSLSEASAEENLVF